MRDLMDLQDTELQRLAASGDRAEEEPWPHGICNWSVSAPGPCFWRGATART